MKIKFMFGVFKNVLTIFPTLVIGWEDPRKFKMQLSWLLFFINIHIINNK